MNKFLQKAQIGIVFIILLVVTISCKEKNADLNPILVKNLQKLEKNEFLAKASYSEKLLFNGLLISETHGDGYFVNADSHYFIENGRMAYFPTQLDLQERNYPKIQELLTNVYDAIPEVSSLIDLPLGFRTIPNSIARVFKSSLLNLDNAGKNILFEEVDDSEGNVIINFSQKNSSSPHPLKGSFTFGSDDLLSKVEIVDYNPFSQIFWEFLQDFNSSNFTILFEEQDDKLVISKAVIKYEKVGYEHTIEMIFEAYQSVDVNFLNKYYSPIVSNEVNPFIFKNKNSNLSENHMMRESKYYFIDTDSVKHTPMQMIDTLILKEIIAEIEN